METKGHMIPLEFANGLARLNLRLFTDDALCSLPHIIMTRDDHWSPHIYDSTDHTDNQRLDDSTPPSYPGHTLSVYMHTTRG